MDDHGRGSGPRPTDSGDAGREADHGADPLAPDPQEPDPVGAAPLGPDLFAPAPPDPLPYEGVWRFTAPAVDASVPQARHAVRDLLYRQGVPVSQDLVQGLLLIVSELVTNAVRHAALLSPMLAVEVAVGAEWVRVSVEDNHPYRPTALEAAHSETGGRGLLLVREITREAGGVCDVEHTAGGGKVIWAALPLTTVPVS
ncbi:ATP-binding protein [Streptomyces griseorubiginosus]|uniref:ATP-binding protein n=1 Tax=Streptomyces griseorubiginosus TaxID=67304 RepID=UPI0033C463E4